MTLEFIQQQSQFLFGETLAIVNEDDFRKQTQEAQRSLTWVVDIAKENLEKKSDYIFSLIDQFQKENWEKEELELQPEPETPLTPFITENY